MSKIGGHTDIENRVQLFAAGSCKEEIHDSVDLVLRVNLMGIESEFQVVKFVRVRLFAEDRGAVVIREGLGDGFVVILKIEHEDIAFFRVGAIQAGERLHCLDAG